MVAFVTVAEEQSFTRAAARLHTAQSAVSATIRALESELGATLFHRSTRRVALSPTGAALLPKARAVLDSVADVTDTMARVKGEISGPLAVGFMAAVTLVDVPRILGDFAKQYPDVQITMRTSQQGSLGLTRMIKSGQLDVAFIANPDHKDPELRLATLASSPLVLAVPLNHPMADRAAASLHEMLDLPFIESPSGYGNRAVVDSAFARAGLTRTSRFEISDIAEAAALARNGLGAIFLPEDMTDALTGLHPIRVDDEDLRLEVAVVTSRRRRQSLATQQLWSVVAGNS